MNDTTNERIILDNRSNKPKKESLISLESSDLLNINVKKNRAIYVIVISISIIVVLSIIFAFIYSFFSKKTGDFINDKFNDKKIKFEVNSNILYTFFVFFISAKVILIQSLILKNDFYLKETYHGIVKYTSIFSDCFFVVNLIIGGVSSKFEVSSIIIIIFTFAQIVSNIDFRLVYCIVIQYIKILEINLGKCKYVFSFMLMYALYSAHFRLFIY